MRVEIAVAEDVQNLLDFGNLPFSLITCNLSSANAKEYLADRTRDKIKNALSALPLDSNRLFFRWHNSWWRWQIIWKQSSTDRPKGSRKQRRVQDTERDVRVEQSVEWGLARGFISIRAFQTRCAAMPRPGPSARQKIWDL